MWNRFNSCRAWSKKKIVKHSILDIFITHSKHICWFVKPISRLLLLPFEKAICAIRFDGSVSNPFVDGKRKKNQDDIAAQFDKIVIEGGNMFVLALSSMAERSRPDLYQERNAFSFALCLCREACQSLTFINIKRLFLWLGALVWWGGFISHRCIFLFPEASIEDTKQIPNETFGFEKWLF